MSVKILGGVARGFALATPKVSTTRPTSVMLKRKIFDSIQDFSQSIFIDLCAGSGSIGFEAASRGAEKTILVENNFKCLQTLKSNSKMIAQKFSISNIEIVKQDAIAWLRANQNLTYPGKVYIFFDPPYELIDLYDAFFDLVKEMKNITVITEACKQKTMKIDEFELKYGEADKIFKQGTSYFAIYHL
jgi:16S rRNA (guanine966-N2)-methyltransferase